VASQTGRKRAATTAFAINVRRVLTDRPFGKAATVTGWPRAGLHSVQVLEVVSTLAERFSEEA
jgi:hypothetical protein